jgi:hypothetical protein
MFFMGEVNKEPYRYNDWLYHRDFQALRATTAQSCSILPRHIRLRRQFGR